MLVLPRSHFKANKKPIHGYKLRTDGLYGTVVCYFGFNEKVNRLRDDVTGVILPETDGGSGDGWNGNGYFFNSNKFGADTSLNVGADFTLIISFKSTSNINAFDALVSHRDSGSGPDNYSIEMRNGKIYLWQTYSSGSFRGYSTDGTHVNGTLKNLVISRVSGSEPKFYINGAEVAASTETGDWTSGASDISSKFAIGGQPYTTAEDILNTTLYSFAAFDSALPNAQELSANPYMFLTRVLPLAYFQTTGGGPTTFFQTNTGSLTPAGDITIQSILSQNINGTLTPTGALSKQISKSFTASITPSGTIQKRIEKVLDGSLTPTGTVIAAVVILLSLAGQSIASGSLVTQFIPFVAKVTNIFKDVFKSVFSNVFKDIDE